MLYTIGEILILLILAALLGLLLGWLIWGRGRANLHSECETRLSEANSSAADADKRATEAAAALAALEAKGADHSASLAARDGELAELKAKLADSDAALSSCQADLAVAKADTEGAEMARDEALSALESARNSDTNTASGLHLLAGAGSSGTGDSDSRQEPVADGVDSTPSALGFSAAAPVAGVAANTSPDDLEEIVGVGPKLNALLIERGITTFRQVAVLTEAEIDQLDDSLPDFNGRVRRENWVSQSHDLHQKKYGTAPTR